MFTIQYGSYFLDLAKGENPMIEMISTAFNNSDDLLGSFSYAIEFADTPNNDVLLNYSGQLAARNSRVDIEVIPHINGFPWKRCTLSYDLQDGKRKGNLKIDNGAFATLIKETDLPQIFVKTKNGVFVDHRWINVGYDEQGTLQAINSSINLGAAPYTFFPYANNNVLGGDSDSYTQSRVINPWTKTGFQYPINNGDEIKGTWYSPSLYLTWVIKKVCAYLGYEATGDFFDDPWINCLVIPNNGIYNYKDVFTKDGFKLAPARHLPKIKINDFFKSLREQYRLIYYFNSDTKQASFTLSDTVITSNERVNLDGCIQRGQYTTKKNPETGYELTQSSDEGDELFKFRPYVKSFFIGSAEIPKTIEVPIGTCFMATEGNKKDNRNPIWRIPEMQQVGNAYGKTSEGSQADNPQDFGRNDFKLKLLSYRGLQPDSKQNLYPYATSDGLGPDAITRLCPSLWLGGDQGILNRYHKKWYNFYLRSEETRLRVLLPNAILNQLSPLKKMRFSTDQGVHLESVFSKIAFQADDEQQLIKSDLTVFPIYNASQSALGNNDDFTSGEVVNPIVIWAYIAFENRTEDTMGWPRRSTVTDRHADIVLYFFYDKAEQYPMEVSGLSVRLIKTSNGKAETIYFTASGSRFVAINQAALYYYRDHLIGSSYNMVTTEYTFVDNNGLYKLI